jgi:hypothetical protein
VHPPFVDQQQQQLQKQLIKPTKNNLEDNTNNRHEDIITHRKEATKMSEILNENSNMDYDYDDLDATSNNNNSSNNP